MNGYYYFFITMIFYLELVNSVKELDVIPRAKRKLLTFQINNYFLSIYLKHEASQLDI